MKQRIKTGVDIAMTVLLLGQMGYHMMDNRMHEWTGVTLCALFLVHHALNPGWHRGLFKGSYSASRIALTLVDLLLTLAMAAVIVSAILVSRHVFDFLGLRMRAVGRRVHMPATMWVFVLTGLHIGLHWHIVLGKIAKRGNRAGVWLARLVLAATVAFGLWEFATRGLWMELLMLREFAFLEYGEPLAVFFASYAAVLCVWAALSYYMGKAIRQTQAPEKNAYNVLAFLAPPCPPVWEEKTATSPLIKRRRARKKRRWARSPARPKAGERVGLHGINPGCNARSAAGGLMPACTVRLPSEAAWTHTCRATAASLLFAQPSISAGETKWTLSLSNQKTIY